MSKKTKRTHARLRATAMPPSGTHATDEQQQPPAPESEPQKRPQMRTAPRPGWLLSLNLSVAVPLEIDDLYQGYQNWDGIPPWMVGEAILFGQVLAERGDRLLYTSERKGETGDMFVGLARALAIMSFAPGGVPFLEEPFDALKQLTNQYGEEAAKAFCRKALQPYFDAVINEIPIACWSEGSEPIAFGTFNAIGWFKRAEGDDLLCLQAERFQGHATWILDPSSRSGYALGLLSHVFEQAEGRLRWSTSSTQSMEKLGDQLLLAARDSSQQIAFQVEPKAAKAWLALYKHSLFTGEHWLLPPELQKKRKT